MASIQLIARLAELTGWRWAFSPLSIGPALGILAIVGLLRSLRARNAGSN
jgi:predicted MFS family arabinose efflux permease